MRMDSVILNFGNWYRLKQTSNTRFTGAFFEQVVLKKADLFYLFYRRRLDEWNLTNLQTIQGCDFIEAGVEVFQEKLSKKEKQTQHSLKQQHLTETKEAITSWFECLVVKLNHLTLPCNLYHPVASVHWSWLSVSSVLSYKSSAAVDSVRFREDSKPERKSIQNS